jgi:hypothetical protein
MTQSKAQNWAHSSVQLSVQGLFRQFVSATDCLRRFPLLYDTPRSSHQADLLLIFTQAFAQVPDSTFENRQEKLPGDQ